MIVLDGAGFTNTTGGTLYESNVRLTAADGSSVTLEPDFQGPAAGGLDPVTVPAIPSFRHIDLPPEPAPTR